MTKSIDSIESKILLDNKADVVKIYLFSKLVEKKIQFYADELEMLVELYMRDGYESKEEMENFCQWCIKHEYRKSRNSFYNFITKFVNNTVLIKKGIHKRNINPEVISPTRTDNIALQQFVMNINNLD